MRNIDPVTPGELLKEEFLGPMGLLNTDSLKEFLNIVGEDKHACFFG